MASAINDLQWVKGVGPQRAKALADEGLNTLADLLHYLPRAYVQRSAVTQISEVKKKLIDAGKFESQDFLQQIPVRLETTIAGIIYKTSLHKFNPRKSLFTVYLKDKSSSAKINFWSFTAFHEKKYKEGMTLLVSGQPELDERQNMVQFTHPDIEALDSEEETAFSEDKILPIYKLSEAMRSAHINSKFLRGLIQQALSVELKRKEESLPLELQKHYNLPDIRTALLNLHFPLDFNLLKKSQYRLKYEESFYYQLSLALQRRDIELTEDAPLIESKSSLARKLYDSLPFQLTGDQKKVLNEIAADFRKGKPMNRLLQGDVGSGKTIIALLTMLMAVDNGYQCAFMAPTEILAEQHYHTIAHYLNPLEVRVALLTGSVSRKNRNKENAHIAGGSANVVVGTHALFQEGMEYNNLGYIVIDEQHRFGVDQRKELIELSKKSFGGALSPHILVMSATPIPRTLSLTAYGHLDVSYIKEKPKGRKPIITKIAFESQRDSVYDFIKEKIDEGKQAYIVYPFVETSEYEDLKEVKAAKEHYEILSEHIFPDLKCGLIHGRMSWNEKEEAMEKFLTKEYDILVATTVIEVGIDVPNANVILIENPERFGLSQLHQLRGRVGRNDQQSFCVLLTKDKFKFIMKKAEDKYAAAARLKAMQETDDGFKIAEADLRLRGPGDILGTKQSGMPQFSHLDIIEDADIIAASKKDASGWLKNDPDLDSEGGKIIRKQLSIKKLGHSYIKIA